MTKENLLTEEVLKPKKEKFLTKEVRVIYYQGKGYIVTQDFFNALNRLDDKGQIKTRDREKLERYCRRLKVDSTFCTIDLGKKKKQGNKGNGNIQKVNIIPIEHLSFLVIPFEPNNNDNNKELNDIYNEFIRWVDELLIKSKAKEKLFMDEQAYKNRKQTIELKTKEDVPVVNNFICIILAKVLGIPGKVTKGMIKELQANYIIDLIELREEIIEIFLQQLMMGHSKTQSEEDTIVYLKKKYGEIE